jgi:hypothetical protein
MTAYQHISSWHHQRHHAWAVCLQLPMDLLALVATELPDLAPLFLVCRAWHEVAKSLGLQTLSPSEFGPSCCISWTGCRTVSAGGLGHHLWLQM